MKASQIGLEAALDAGPQHLDRDRARGPSRVATSARCTWAIEAAATGAPNVANIAPTGLPNAAATTASASSCGKRRHLVLQAFEIARERRADDIRARRQELPELDVSSAQAA